MLFADVLRSPCLALALTAGLAVAADTAAPATPPAAGGVAPKPVFRDPPFDHATDPVLVYNAERQSWLMYYTQRRGGSIPLIHGTKIGMAESKDHGVTWTYLGTADITYGQDRVPKDYTYWAPEVIWVDGTYHMFLTFVPGIFEDWRHPREIGHLTSKDGLKWETVGKIDLKSEKVIDACVIALPNGGGWRMFFKDEASKTKHIINYADSPDLYQWEAKGPIVTDRNGEGPKCFHWQGKYWLLSDTDRPENQAVWSSDDATHWTPQATTVFGNHGDVVVNGDRAWWFYFGGTRGGNPRFGQLPSTRPDAPAIQPRERALPIHVVELKVVDGKLMYTDPRDDVRVDLGDQREEER